MEEMQIFPMTSGDGYGAVVHGNFVTVCRGMSEFHAQVQAFQTDGGSQFETFETIAEAVAWAFAAAQKHLGKPHQFSKIEYWEIRNGYSITINLTEDTAKIACGDKTAFLSFWRKEPPQTENSDNP